LKGLQERVKKSEVMRVEVVLEEMKKLVRGNIGLLFAKDI